MAAGHLPETRFKVTVSGTQNDDLGVGVGEETLCHLQQQIHPLLIDQTADHADHKSVGVDVKAHALLQLLLAERLAAQVVVAVGGGNALVGRRIPGLDVNAVEDAAQLAADVIQQPFQLLAVFGGADLLGIGGGDSIDPVGVQQGRRHGVIALHVPGTPGHALELPAPGALVLEVVNGEDRADLRVLVHPHRNHAGVPVMAVQHLGLPHIPSELGGGTGEEGETPVFVLTAVDAFTIKDRMAHQVDGEAVAGVTGLEHSELRAHGLGPPDGFAAHLQAGPKLAVARHDDPHVVAQFGQSGRQ